MKLLLLFFASVYLRPAVGQQTTDRFPLNNQYRVVAKNEKHTRKYANRPPLKITYWDSDITIKAKGRLLFYNNDEIQLLPYRNRDIITIKIASIVSIQRWNRPGKKAIAILAGTGVLALGVAALAADRNYSNEIFDGSLLSLLLVVYAIIDFYYIGWVLPVVFISEWLSVRSEKKGYHFYVEERKPIKN
ncbi:MAG: hypothetical protein M3Z92_08895 [Bacteroidota bacterium]|nr:hypothetical protein [Bacteroidota bacterium]